VHTGIDKLLTQVHKCRVCKSWTPKKGLLNSTDQKQNTGSRETDVPSQLTSHRNWPKDGMLNSYKHYSCHLHEYF